MKGRPILWMIIISVSGFLLMIVLLGTRHGERKAKLSSKDLGTLTEIKLDGTVLDATITNVRVLYAVAPEEDYPDPDSLARRYCEVAKKNEALVEMVRIVKVDRAIPIKEGKPNFVLLSECNCAAIRVRAR